MEIRKFNYDLDNDLVRKILRCAAEAHREAEHSLEWFRWKYQGSPFGETTLVVAMDGDKIAGVVGFGVLEYVYSGRTIRAAISYETFVTKAYQGKGLFKRLIKAAEDEMKKQDISFFLNFPNSNSLPGFLKMGWTKLDIVEYWILVRNRIKVATSLKDLREQFVATPYDEKLAISIPDVRLKYSGFRLNATTDYLNWRFSSGFSYSYGLIRDELNTVIYRRGKRGKLKEAQIVFCHIEGCDNKTNARVMHDFVSEIASRECVDIIGFPISKNNPIKKNLKMLRFIRVPTHTNCTYKLIDKEIQIDAICLSGVDFHTY